MGNVRTIKGIDRETWLKFKELAAKKGLTMNVLFKNMVGEYEKESEEFWNFILSGEKRISDKEAKEMYEDLKKLREDKGFRNVPNF